MRLGSILIAISLALCLACGKRSRVAVLATEPVQKQEGLASWYGKDDGYHGKQTASGERFDSNELTAAHYDLPFGSHVAVTNKKNGKQVVVRINDRFPLKTLQKGRVIDLSYKAAEILGMVRDGVVPVTLVILSIPGPED